MDGHYDDTPPDTVSLLEDILCPACFARLEEITTDMVRLGLWLEMGPEELVMKALERLAYEHTHRN